MQRLPVKGMQWTLVLREVGALRDPLCLMQHGVETRVFR